jgi:hypothetical protein
LLFVIDNSGSMQHNDPDRITHQMVARFAGRLSADSRLGIVVFDEGVRLVEPLGPAAGAESEGRRIIHMASIDYRGQRTNSPAGIERALYELRTNGRADAERIIVFITDGLVDTGDPVNDREKKRWLTNELSAEASRAGVRIFGIAFTEGADVELIQALALRTDADYFRIQKASEIGPVLDEVGRTIEGSANLAASSALPPVAAPSARSDKSSVLLALGIALGALAVAAPLVLRRRRQPRAGRRERPPEPSGPGAEYAAPGFACPTGMLVDVAAVSAKGLLPFSLAASRTRIGRDPANDVVIDHPTVSTFQATIDFRDGYYQLEDHRSTNGTRLNGERLAQSGVVRLKSGDRIDFADYEFRFVIPEHEPHGKTLVMDQSSVVDFADPLSNVEHSTSAGMRDEPRSFPEAFDHCLTVHLNKVRSLGERYRSFLHESFQHDLVDVLSQRASDLIQRCEKDEEGQVLDLTKSGVHYTLVVLPMEIQAASSWFVSHHGGFSNFLAKLLDDWSARERHCTAICVLTFGMAEEPWISLTVLPATSSDDAVEIMSFEFLTPEERRRALSYDIVDLGRGAQG